MTPEDIGLGGRMDSNDVGTDDYNHQNRDSLKGVCQWFLEAWKISHFADLTTSHGVKDEAKFQAAHALDRLKLKIEKYLLSDTDCAVESGVDQPNETRGVGRWLENDAASINTEYPIPSDYRVSSDCEFTDPVDEFGAGDLQGMLQAASLQMEKARTWDAFLGLKLKSQMDDWTEHDPDATETNVALKSFNAMASDKSYLKQVDFFQFSAGIVRAHVNYNLLCDKATGAKSNYSSRSGYFLDMDQWKIAFMAGIATHRLPDLGGGPRGYHDATLGLKCLMPVGQAIAKISADT